MADVPQWRLKIPTSRSRTPLLEVTEPDQEMRPSTPRTGTPTLPPTPKRGLRPKLSSYLTQSGPFGSTSKPEPEPSPVPSLRQTFPSWAVEDTFPNPNADQLMDTILRRLMSHPLQGLGSSFNSSLTTIFEEFRHLQDEKDRLERILTEEMESRHVERITRQQAEYDWEDERKTYKAEVKRLELIIAKGKRGVAEVALARQGSLIRRRKEISTVDDGDEGRMNVDDGKETVFEFLEKTKRFEDPAWSSQRATMKSRKAGPVSPSTRMAKLSRKLVKKTSKTSILAELPFGTPPLNLRSTSLLHASYMEDQAAAREGQRTEDHSHATLEGRVSLSDDTASTFSCPGDLLPDEISDKGSHIVVPSFEQGTDHEIAGIVQTAATVLGRRGIDADSVMPRLLELLRPQMTTVEVSVNQAEGLQPRPTPSVPAAVSSSAPPSRKPSHIMGFINRLKPQLSLDTSLGPRRFSFEFGDDTGPIGPSPQHTTSRESLLRKSVSFSSFPEKARRAPAAGLSFDLSPVECSPVASARTSTVHPVIARGTSVDASPIESNSTTSVRTPDSRRTSKIPSPAYNAALAKPRQNHDDAMSGLLTATKDLEYTTQRSGSCGGSVYSTRSLHRPTTSNSSNVSRAAPPRATGTIADLLDRDRRYGNVGLSLTDAAGTPSGRHLGDNTNIGHAGTSIGGSTMSTRDRGSADISNTPSLKTHSSTRSGEGSRSGPVHNAYVYTAGAESENARPFVHPSRRDDDD